jgi:hypothetical protein
MQSAAFNARELTKLYFRFTRLYKLVDIEQTGVIRVRGTIQPVETLSAAPTYRIHPESG